MATTTRPTSATTRPAPRRKTGSRATTTQRPTRDLIPPHWPDGLDVPVPSMTDDAPA